jgi:hypothetical protein
MDGRVDQYAVGVIAYEALTGVRPNDGSHEGETLACILGGKHVPICQRLPSLSPGLGSIIERMLALRPEQRFSSMDSVLDALSAYTPPLIAHRALVPLVVAARQPHTIVQENGRFISRPVEAEPLLRGAATLTPPPARRLPGASTPPALPNGAAGMLAMHSPPVKAQPAVMLAVTLGGSEPNLPAVSPRAPKGVPVITEPEREAIQSPFTPLSTPLSTPVPVAERRERRVERSSKASPKRSWIDRVLASRLFWQGLTGVGAALLVFVAWAAFSPEALLLLAAEPATQVVAPVGRSSLGASSAPVAALTTTRPKDGPIEATGKDAAKVPTADDAPQVSARVQVVPNGQVWVDQELIGEASPALELSIRAGVHVISVGRDHPIRSQTIDFKPGPQQLLSFDLEGK